MIINLTGLPGAGKSTSETYLISGLQKRGFKIIQNTELKSKLIKEKIFSRFNRDSLIGILPRLIFRIKIFRFYLQVCIENKLGLNFFLKKRGTRGIWLSEDIILTRYFINEFKGSNSIKNIFFCTEGLVHHWACMKVWAGKHSDIFDDNWLNQYPSDGIQIIYLKVPVEMALERLVKRGVPSNWPQPGNGKLGHMRFILERYDSAINETVKEFRAKGAKVHTLDASCDIEQMEINIEACLDSLSY